VGHRLPTILCQMRWESKTSASNVVEVASQVKCSVLGRFSWLSAASQAQ